MGDARGPLAPVLAVVGPTASGKSALALRLAQSHGGEVVSCDSLQVYRGLDIGSAKPSAEERQRAPHHLIDVVDPDADFSAAQYTERARAAIDDIRARGRSAIVAGGTGLYLRALLGGLFEGPSRDDRLRRRLASMADRFGDARLHRWLSRVDAETAGQTPPRDRVRIVRALEVFLATGRPISAHHREHRAQAAAAPWPVRIVGLSPPRDVLRARVEERTRAMWARGLLEETRGLRARYAQDLRPLRAIGYRQAAAVLDGELTEAQALRDMVGDTMRYAKRQMTWFRHQAQVAWFAEADEALAAATAALEGR